MATSQELRAMGMSEEEIARVLIAQSSGSGDMYGGSSYDDYGNPISPPLPTGVARYDEYGNPIIIPNEVTPAITGLDAPEPSQEAIDMGLTRNVNEAPVPQAVPQAVPQHAPQQSVVQQEMNGIGGPDTPVQGMQEDPMGSFFAGASNAQLTPYAGGLQQIADMIGGGAMAYRKELADQRNRMKPPASVREYEYAVENGFDGSFTDYKEKFGGNAFNEMMRQMMFQNTLSQQEWQRGQAAQKMETDAERDAYKREQDAIQNEINREKREATEERRMWDQSQKLDKAIPDELIEMQGALDNVRAMASQYKMDEDGNVDMAGLGPIEGAVPGFLVGDEATDNRAAMAAVRNTILKARSGGAVSDGEANRMLEELASGAGKGEAGMLRAMNNIQKTMNEKWKGKYGAFPPEVVRKRLGKDFEEYPPVYRFGPRPTRAQARAERARRKRLREEQEGAKK